MAGRKRAKKDKGSHTNSMEVSSTFSESLSSTIAQNSTMNVTNENDVREHVQQAIADIRKKIHDFKHISNLKLNEMLSGYTQKELNAPVILNTTDDLISNAILSKEISLQEASAEHFAQNGYTTVKKLTRRSKSLVNKKETDTKSKNERNLSVSPPSSAFKVKRVMRLNEEAISKCGSPLFVHESTIEMPQVNIPLEGGSILNIKPKKAKSVPRVPNLDPKTKQQLKILCENIQKCIED